MQKLILRAIFIHATDATGFILSALQQFYEARHNPGTRRDIFPAMFPNSVFRLSQES